MLTLCGGSDGDACGRADATGVNSGCPSHDSPQSLNPLHTNRHASISHRDEVKAAFRRAALVCHPDVDKSPQAAARFTQVKLAADVLLKGVGRLLLIAVPWEAAARATTGCTVLCWGMWQLLTSRSVRPQVAHKWHVCFPHALPLPTSSHHSQHTAQPGTRSGWTAAAASAAATGQAAPAAGVPRNRTAALWAGLLVACGLAFGYGWVHEC